ncbi:hypothetical protein Pfo_009583 [Paulownia fortunei]|nr:hypothetical protein Pfo_009583 [Paulownia fortunei]
MASLRGFVMLMMLLVINLTNNGEARQFGETDLSLAEKKMLAQHLSGCSFGGGCLPGDTLSHVGEGKVNPAFKCSLGGGCLPGNSLSHLGQEKITPGFKCSLAGGCLPGDSHSHLKEEKIPPAAICSLAGGGGCFPI